MIQDVEGGVTVRLVAPMAVIVPVPWRETELSVMVKPLTQDVDWGTTVRLVAPMEAMVPVPWTVVVL